MRIAIIFVLAFILDLILGDPKWLYHPVRIIAKLISGGEKLLRKIFKKNLFIAGMILTISVCVICFAFPFFLLKWLYALNYYLGFCVETFFCYQILATKCLRDEAMRIYRYLSRGDIVSSRKYVGYIVGRDTDKLDEKGVTKAVIETVAENTTDGIVAPMIFMIIGGAPLGFLYKTVNTFDSMIGYKNEKYIDFGHFAAKTDDVFNFIPARFTAIMMIVCSALPPFSFKGAVKIFKRDRKNHKSPNSARTESVAAGALGIMLGGDAYYFGKLHKKQTIGDDTRTPVAADIKNTVKLMYLTATLSFIVLLSVRLFAIWVI